MSLSLGLWEFRRRFFQFPCIFFQLGVSRRGRVQVGLPNGKEWEGDL